MFKFGTPFLKLVRQLHSLEWERSVPRGIETLLSVSSFQLHYLCFQTDRYSLKLQTTNINSNFKIQISRVRNCGKRKERHWNKPSVCITFDRNWNSWQQKNEVHKSFILPLFTIDWIEFFLFLFGSSTLFVMQKRKKKKTNNSNVKQKTKVKWFSFSCKIKK